MDVPVGQDATIPFDVRERLTGTPVQLGTIGAWSVYGPLSTTAVATGTGAAEHGDGVYSVNATAAQVATPGTYTLDYAVTAPPEAVGSYRTTFRVGTPVPGAWRMWDLLVAVIRGTGGSVRRADIIDDFIIEDSYYSGNTFAALEGSEVVLISPVSAYADWFTARVNAFNEFSGEMTLSRDTGISRTDQYYAITNPRGMGWTFERILDELRAAYDILPITELASVSVGLESSLSTLEIPLPAHLLSVASVAVRDQGMTPGDLWDDLDGRYEVLPDRRLLRLDEGLGLGSGQQLRVTGAVRCELPRLGGSWTDIRGAYLRQKIRHALFSTSENDDHQRMAQVMFGDLITHGSPYRSLVPGEIKLA